MGCDEARGGAGCAPCQGCSEGFVADGMGRLCGYADEGPQLATPPWEQLSTSEECTFIT